MRNDALSAAQALALQPDAVLLSPGPRGPEDAGLCVELIRSAPADLPILGVCLGHQAIGAAFGARIAPSREVMHGKTSLIRHRDDGVLAGLPDPFTAARYHSLAVARDSMPDSLAVNAWTQDGEIMGLRHVSRPVHGVQFHPESIASEHGYDILRRFLDMAVQRR